MCDPLVICTLSEYQDLLEAPARPGDHEQPGFSRAPWPGPTTKYLLEVHCDSKRSPQPPWLSDVQFDSPMLIHVCYFDRLGQLSQFSRAGQQQQCSNVYRLESRKATQTREQTREQESNTDSLSARNKAQAQQSTAEPGEKAPQSKPPNDQTKAQPR